MQLDVFSTVHHSIELFHQRADAVRSQPVYCADVYRERRYQMPCEYHFPPEDGHVSARNMSRIIV